MFQSLPGGPLRVECLFEGFEGFVLNTGFFPGVCSVLLCGFTSGVKGYRVQVVYKQQDAESLERTKTIKKEGLKGVAKLLAKGSLNATPGFQRYTKKPRNDYLRLRNSRRGERRFLLITAPAPPLAGLCDLKLRLKLRESLLFNLPVVFVPAPSFWSTPARSRSSAATWGCELLSCR